ncbi:MAG: type II toxin-antitoxin system YhaV family toxin [Burkholderiales bacterium]|nr:type II toxin-antitoxin system YhaV family toxin [Burkholderiales bacterium]
MQRHSWNLLFHDGLIEQLQKLQTAAQKAQTQDPQGFESNANVKLFNALAQLMLETVPSDPSRDEYRQGNTMGPAFRHWRRAKLGRRFRLFFRFDSKTRIIIFMAMMEAQTYLAKRQARADLNAFDAVMARTGGEPPREGDRILPAQNG